MSALRKFSVDRPIQAKPLAPVLQLLHIPQKHSLLEANAVRANSLLNSLLDSLKAREAYEVPIFFNKE